MFPNMDTFRKVLLAGPTRFVEPSTDRRDPEAAIAPVQI